MKKFIIYKGVFALLIICICCSNTDSELDEISPTLTFPSVFNYDRSVAENPNQTYINTESGLTNGDFASSNSLIDSFKAFANTFEFGLDGLAGLTKFHLIDSSAITLVFKDGGQEFSVNTGYYFENDNQLIVTGENFPGADTFYLSTYNEANHYFYLPVLNYIIQSPTGVSDASESWFQDLELNNFDSVHLAKFFDFSRLEVNDTVSFFYSSVIFEEQ